MMDTFTHDDCGFASDDSVGACAGEVSLGVSLNLEATCEADLVFEAGLPLCERHSALV